MSDLVQKGTRTSSTYIYIYILKNKKKHKEMPFKNLNAILKQISVNFQSRLNSSKLTNKTKLFKKKWSTLAECQLLFLRVA